MSTGIIELVFRTMQINRFSWFKSYHYFSDSSHFTALITVKEPDNNMIGHTVIRQSALKFYFGER